MRIFVIRHGEAVDDIEDCYGGIADFVLTPQGVEQAHVTARNLRDANIKVVYSSPLRRALQTAEVICEVLGIARPSVVNGLQERNSYGVLSGVNKDKAKDIFGHIFATLKEKPGYSKEPIPGCEPWDEFAVRVRDTFEMITSVHSDETIALVTHGKFSQCLFEDVLKIKDKVDLKLSAVNVLEYQPGSARMGVAASVA